MSGQVAEKDDLLEGRDAIMEYLGISKATYYAWRDKYNQDHPNPLPLGYRGRTPISTKTNLKAWNRWFLENAETELGPN